MPARPHSFALIAALIAAAVATTGCEDDVVFDDGIPADEVFLAATRGAIAAHPPAVNANLQLLRASTQLELVAGVERRLRTVVPAAIARDVDADETVDATYDETRGEWTITGRATSGDSLEYTFDATISYIDSTGARVPDVEFGAVAFGEYRESYALDFRTGDFATTESYEASIRTELAVDIAFPALLAQADTFFVDADTEFSLRTKAAGDTTEVLTRAIDARYLGQAGPNRNNSTGCFTASAGLTVLWREFEGRLQISNNVNARLEWQRPEDEIQDVPRILFTQSLPLDCQP